MNTIITIGMFAVLALIVIGLGVNGTVTAVMAGAKTVDQNPTVQNIVNQTKTAVENQVHTELTNAANQVVNATANVVAQKVGAAMP